MLQTENLKLNIIEGSDPVSPEPINENFQALEEAIIQARESVDATNDAILVVKLAEQTVEEDTTLVTLDLSAIDMSTYQSLQLFVENLSANQSTALWCQVNGDDSASYYSTGSAGGSAVLATVPYSGTADLRCEIFGGGNHVLLRSVTVYDEGSSASNYTYTYTYLGCGLDNIKTLVFSPPANYQLRGEMIFRLYGLKK